MLLSGGGQTRMVLSPGPTGTLASKAGVTNPGIVVVEVVDESNLAPHRLRVRLVNISGKHLDKAAFGKMLRPLDWRLMMAVDGVGRPRVR